MHDHSGDDRNGRIDVGDRRRLDGSDLRDKSDHEEEGERTADDGEHDDRGRRFRGWPHAGPAAGEEHDRNVDERGTGKRYRDDSDARKVRHPARQDGRSERIPDNNDAHLENTRQVGAADVEADQGGDAEHPDEDAEPVEAGELRRAPHEERDRDARERHGGEQQAGGGARQLLLRRAQEVPRQHDLDDRVGEHRLPAAQHDHHLAPEERERHQQHRREPRPREHDHCGLELADGDLDEQVRDAPGQPQTGEEEYAAASHVTIVAPY